MPPLSGTIIAYEQPTGQSLVGYLGPRPGQEGLVMGGETEWDGDVHLSVRVPFSSFNLGVSSLNRCLTAVFLRVMGHGTVSVIDFRDVIRACSLV